MLWFSLHAITCVCACVRTDILFYFIEFKFNRKKKLEENKQLHPIEKQFFHLQFFLSSSSVSLLDFGAHSISFPKSSPFSIPHIFTHSFFSYSMCKFNKREIQVSLHVDSFFFYLFFFILICRIVYKYYPTNFTITTVELCQIPTLNPSK